MPITFRVYGTSDTCPPPDELIEALEELEFEVTIEDDSSKEDSDEDSEEGEEAHWTELEVYEESIDGALKVTRLTEEDDFSDEIEELLTALAQEKKTKETRQLTRVLQNCVSCYEIELADDLTEDDNALLLCSTLAQQLAQRCEGVYCLGEEGFFSEAGDFLLSLAEEEAD